MDFMDNYFVADSVKQELMRSNAIMVSLLKIHCDLRVEVTNPNVDSSILWTKEAIDKFIKLIYANVFAGVHRHCTAIELMHNYLIPKSDDYNIYWRGLKVGY